MAQVCGVMQVFLALATCSFGVATDMQVHGGTNFLLIGNPGTGKSTILNGMIGRLAFKSGVSYGSGMTYQFDVVQEGQHRYMDTPGLSDVKMRQKAADAITEALKQNGYYKVFFVVVLQNGRVRPEDIATMTLVLNAAPITHYGVIINQLSAREYKDLLSQDSGAAKNVLGAIWTAVGREKASAHVHFWKREEDLEGADNVVKSLPNDLSAFISQTPGMEIRSQEVQQVRANEFEHKMEQLEQRITNLQKDKEQLHVEMQKVWKGRDEEIQRIRSQQQWEMQRIRSQQERSRGSTTAGDVFAGNILSALALGGMALMVR